MELGNLPSALWEKAEGPSIRCGERELPDLGGVAPVWPSGGAREFRAAAIAVDGGSAGREGSADLTLRSVQTELGGFQEILRGSPKTPGGDGQAHGSIPEGPPCEPRAHFGFAEAGFDALDIEAASVCQDAHRVCNHPKGGLRVWRVHVDELVDRAVEPQHNLPSSLDAPDGVLEDRNKQHLAAAREASSLGRVLELPGASGDALSVSQCRPSGSHADMAPGGHDARGARFRRVREGERKMP